MKIAITGPHFWPYRRRGSASYINNISKFLAKEGHEIDIITGKPGRSRTVCNERIKIFYLKYLQHPLLLNFNIDRVHMFSINSLKHFLVKKYDVIYSIYHPSGFSLSLLKEFKKLKYVQLIPTTPFKLHWRHSQIDYIMFKRAIKEADKCIVPSEYAYKCIKNDNNIICEIIPCGVDMEHFNLKRNKNESIPSILCTAALHDERKNIHILVKAFNNIIKNGTNAILRLAGETTLYTNKKLLSLVDDDVKKNIEILPFKTYMELPNIYSKASVTVLSSENETFGMTLLESLACGTPVVGTYSGAIPEIIKDDSIGTMFIKENNEEATIENLSYAIKKTIKLSMKEKTKENCRSHASNYNWQKIVKRLERIYKDI